MRSSGRAWNRRSCWVRLLVGCKPRRRCGCRCRPRTATVTRQPRGAMKAQRSDTVSPPSSARCGEGALERSAPPQIRRVVLRTSFVLGRDGGALRRLATLARLGLGGPVGTGRQGISWIHELDMNRLFTRAIAEGEMSGAYLATAPSPVPNAEFMRELRRAMKVPFDLPAMAWMVRIAAPLLRTDPELALYGRYCHSTRLRNEGFEFIFPDIRSALNDIYGSSA